ncbi:MAG: 30S ribosomal protein S9 [bacterium]|nr:30S ribosomal protein S9 [bacterium]
MATTIKPKATKATSPSRVKSNAGEPVRVPHVDVAVEAREKIRTIKHSRPNPPVGEEGVGTPTRYIEAVGRRKRAIARVRASVGAKTIITVNGKPVEKYFGTEGLCAIVSAPLSREGFSGKYVISIHVKGGGSHAQAEAIRHGLSRILVKENEGEKGALKKLGFLRRDSRKVERKHFGLKKARKRKQWKKR